MGGGGALWGQPRAGVPSGDGVSSALGAAQAPCGLTVAKEVHCTTARPPPASSGAPGPAGGGTRSPNPPHHARDTPCAETVPHPPPRAGPCARWTAWGSAGDTWARRKAEERGFAAAAPSRLQFAVRFVAAAGECGNRSGAGSSGEAAGLLHIRVLTPRLVSPSFRPAPLPRPRPMTRPTAPPASGNLGAH